MVYRNDDPMALMAMENDRLGGYGDEFQIGGYMDEYWDEKELEMREEPRYERL